MTETEAMIVNEFVAGSEVPEIAARYAVSEDYIDRLIEQTHVDKPIKVRRKHDWSWNNWGNRLVYCIAAGFVTNLATGISALGVIVAVVLFVLTSAIVAVRR